MPDRKSARRKRARQEFEAHARAEAAARAEMYRRIGQMLSFWRFCGKKPCLRAGHCAGEIAACFERMWQQVPDDIRFHIQVLFESRDAGMSVKAAVAEADRRVQQWQETLARCDALYPPQQSPQDMSPESLPPQPPAPAGPAPKAQPRIRSL